PLDRELPFAQWFVATARAALEGFCDEPADEVPERGAVRRDLCLAERSCRVESFFVGIGVSLGHCPLTRSRFADVHDTRRTFLFAVPCPNEWNEDPREGTRSDPPILRQYRAELCELLEGFAIHRADAVPGHQVGGAR